MLLPLLVGHSPENIESFSELGCKWMLRNSTNLNSAEHIFGKHILMTRIVLNFLWCTSLVLEWGASNFRRKLRHNSRGRKTLVGVRWHSSFQIPQRQRDAGNKNQDRQRETYAPPFTLWLFCWCFFFFAAQVPFLLVKMHGHSSWVMEQSLHMQHLIAAGFVWK